MSRVGYKLFNLTHCIYQAIPLMSSWHYNWTAAHAVLGEQVYFSTQDFDGFPKNVVPNVLVLGPTIQMQLAELKDLRAFHLKLQQLVKFSVMSGRVPVWPTVDCTARFLGQKDGGVNNKDVSTQRRWPEAPFENPVGWLPYFNRQMKEVYCFSMALMEPQCLFDNSGMTVWEFEHLYKRHRFIHQRHIDGEADRGQSSRLDPDQIGPDQIGHISIMNTIKALTDVSGGLGSWLA